MQRGWITLTLAASLQMVSANAAHAPEPVLEPSRSFSAPPPPPVRKPFDEDLGAIEISEGELRCLALTVYWESNREPLEGQLAVAHVVLNRVGRAEFAGTICGVVHQGGPHFPCQFHWYCTGNNRTPKDSRGWEQAIDVARQALGGVDPTNGALYFHLASMSPPWSKGHHENARLIGHHIFFRGRP